MSKRLTLAEFIEKSREIHGDRYDYSKVNYVNAQTKVCIICPEHGEFWQTANKHIHSKHNCPMCSGIGQTTQGFILNSIKIHGDTYDYSKSIFTKAINKVIIICKEHGEFLQQARCHIWGQGCPQCINIQNSKPTKQIVNFLIENNILFKKEKSFNDCRNIDTNDLLYYDFYLPGHNILIEYDGEQHFKSIKHWGGDLALDNCKKRDKIKDAYAAANNIKLIRIPYWEQHNIINILEKEIICE